MASFLNPEITNKVYWCIIKGHGDILILGLPNAGHISVIMNDIWNHQPYPPSVEFTSKTINKCKYYYNCEERSGIWAFNIGCLSEDETSKNEEAKVDQEKKQETKVESIDDKNEDENQDNKEHQGDKKEDENQDNKEEEEEGRYSEFVNQCYPAKNGIAIVIEDTDPNKLAIIADELQTIHKIADAHTTILFVHIINQSNQHHMKLHDISQQLSLDSMNNREFKMLNYPMHHVKHDLISLLKYCFGNIPHRISAVFDDGSGDKNNKPYSSIDSKQGFSIFAPGTVGRSIAKQEYFKEKSDRFNCDYEAYVRAKESNPGMTFSMDDFKIRNKSHTANHTHSTSSSSSSSGSSNSSRPHRAAYNNSAFNGKQTATSTASTNASSSNNKYYADYHYYMHQAKVNAAHEAHIQQQTTLYEHL